MKFDKTINIPTLIAASTLLMSVAAAWSNINERTAKTEAVVTAQNDKVDMIEARQAMMQSTMRDEMIRRLDSLQADVREIRAAQRRQ